MKIAVKKWSAGLSVILLASLLPLQAQAHRMWLLPSATVFSGNDAWVTVDAGISNNLFYAEDFPIRLDGLLVTGPDGMPVKTENAVTGHYRSVFDVRLIQPGTYKIAVVNRGLFANYTLNGEKKRWRGTEQNLATELPGDAKDVQITQSDSRIETFVTRGKPTDTALKITGQGLEMMPLSVPTDMVVGNTANFRMLVDGQAAGNMKVTIARGVNRYEERANDATLTTDTDGRFSYKWPSAGMYWISAQARDNAVTVKRANARNAGYAATLEVAPQ